MEPQRTIPEALAHLHALLIRHHAATSEVRSRYLVGVVPLIGGEVEAAAEVTVSNKAPDARRAGRGTTWHRESRSGTPVNPEHATRFVPALLRAVKLALGVLECRHGC